MYSDRLMDLFRNACHSGDLPEATHFGQAGQPGGGPWIQLFFRVDAEGLIREARWRTYGCPAAIACSEAVCVWTEGQPWEVLASLTPAEISDWVGEVPEGKEHCPALAALACRGIRPTQLRTEP